MVWRTRWRMIASYHLRRRRASRERRQGRPTVKEALPSARGRRHPPYSSPAREGGQCWEVCGLALLAFACARPSYLEVQLTLPTGPGDRAQEVEWLDLAASDGTPSDAGPTRIPSSPVAGGLGVAYPKLILAVSAPSGSQVDVLINGLDAAG